MAELHYLTAEQMAEETQRILLLYGPSGTGKSYLAAQFPDPLILACDPGTSGGFPSSAIKFNPKIIVIKSYSHALGLITELRAQAGKAFQTLVVDSLSFFQRHCMSHILQMVGREIPRFDEWNLNAERMRKFFELICEVPSHIIFTATDGTMKDEVTGKITGGPDLPGKLANELPRYCEVVARLYVTSSYDKSGKLVSSYKYRIVGDDTWFAKDRTGLLQKEGLSEFESFKPLFQNKKE